VKAAGFIIDLFGNERPVSKEAGSAVSLSLFDHAAGKRNCGLCVFYESERRKRRNGAK
jgi:hypothetical protein